MAIARLSVLATFNSTVITSQSEYIILFFILACVNSTAKLTIRHCHKKTSYVSNYAFFTLLHKWVDRGQTHHFEKLQQYTSSDEIEITHRGVSIIGASALYRPIHAIK